MQRPLHSLLLLVLPLVHGLTSPGLHKVTLDGNGGVVYSHCQMQHTNWSSQELNEARSSNTFRGFDMAGLDLSPYTVTDDYFGKGHERNAAAVFAAKGPLLPSLNPYIVLPRYYTEAEADAIAADALGVVNDAAPYDVAHTGCYADLGAGERRKYSTEQFTTPGGPLDLFNREPDLQRVAACHLHQGGHATMRITGEARAETMVSAINVSGKAIGSSASGWHKDKVGTTRGFKATVYLQDISKASQGPFSMLLGYRDEHSPEQPSTSGSSSGPTEMLQTCNARAFKAEEVQPRYAEADILAHAKSGWPRTRIVQILAPKGSVILFETTSVHRGGDLSNGTRAVAINYYGDHINLPVAFPKACHAKQARALHSTPSERQVALFERHHHNNETIQPSVCEAARLTEAVKKAAVEEEQRVRKSKGWFGR